MSTFFVADWHLGDARLEILQRPFSSPTEAAQKLVENHNAIVKPDDEVIVVGDVCTDIAWLPWASSFNGRKTLIRGNHDRRLSDEQALEHFVKVVPEGDGIEMEQDGIPLWVTHYPTSARKDRFNIVGHIHATWKVQLNTLNVGVDVHHMRPLPAERIRFFHDAIMKFYDDDVWVAYQDENASFRGTRGKPGSYLADSPPTPGA